MKKVTILTLAIIIHTYSYAQESATCESIVSLIADGISNKSTGALEDHMSDEFTIAGQKGNRAKMVLSQLFQQLNDEIIDINKKGEEHREGRLILNYEFVYRVGGLRQTSITFNKDNKITELVLLDMEVQVMGDAPKAEKADKNVINIPFRLVGKLICVEVMLNGEKRDFLLDTGSPTIVLNAKYLKDNDDNETVKSPAKGVNGAINNMRITEVEKLDFGGITVKEQEVISIDLAHLEEKLETDIYGLIGYDIIQDYDILFDYENSMITLIEPTYYEKYKKSKLKRSKIYTVPLEMSRHIPTIAIEIADKVYNVGIDSGAESNLMDDDYLQILKPYLLDIETDSLAGAGSEISEVISGEIKASKIAGLNFSNLHTVFTDISHLNSGYNIDLSGLIGYQVISKQKTLISFTRKKLVFFR